MSTPTLLSQHVPRRRRRRCFRLVVSLLLLPTVCPQSTPLCSHPPSLLLLAVPPQSRGPSV